MDNGKEVFHGSMNPQDSRPEMLTRFAQNIMFMMFRDSLSQEQVVTETKIPEKTLSRVLANKHERIDPKVLTGLCDLFGLTPNDLLLEREDVDYNLRYVVVSTRRKANQRKLIKNT
jgi:DNA-binding Xre family transcriptional regulator